MNNKIYTVLYNNIIRVPVAEIPTESASSREMQIGVDDSVYRNGGGKYGGIYFYFFKFFNLERMT